ncbi:MAG: 4-(cytidine 5'-diphospho)-2-C-methyl-D-erythritol kinase [Acidobacteriota bacterium]|nr:4-(cytidine 5'-diphospho)-2-C-methyl-D-erythritol kinase [Acidobacteriota bacterium]
MTALFGEAPAKINRELRVGARRTDGFHEILSRFTSIDLADRIEVEPAGSLELVCEGRPVPSDDTNLVLRAARALARELGAEPRARIRLFKRIPIGAGLGGGSSDAAETLRLLRALWSPELSDERLAAIAPALGSDVPFFLEGGEAQVSGRGETVVPLPDAPPAELLLVFPPFPISTRDVFGALARSRASAGSLPPRLEIESSGGFFGPNELASAVLETKSAMKEYLESAAEAATEFGITGSGSTVVLLGADPGAEQWLAQRHPEASFLRTRTLSREEYRAATLPPGGSEWTSRK